MNDFQLISKVIYYLLFVLLLFLYARYKYKKHDNDGKGKFGILALIFFAILFGVYGILCGPPGERIGDRHNYALRFENTGYEELVKENSVGLFVIESILQLFTRNSSVLFFCVSVLYFCINIYCYKKLKVATPFYLLLFFLSTMGLYGFFALKQALSLAFINLALTKYFQNRRFQALVFLVVAILFHEATWIVIPCFILAKLCKGSKIRQLMVYISAIIVAVLFPQISSFFVSVFSFIPGMENQISSYLDESGSILIDLNIFTIMKSAPYYIITITAFLFRKKLKDSIENYDFLLALSVFCSIFSILSLYMYWMFRFAMYCYVPCFILASQIALHLKVENAKVFKIVTVGILLALMVKLLIQYYYIYGGIV